MSLLKEEARAISSLEVPILQLYTTSSAYTQLRRIVGPHFLNCRALKKPRRLFSLGINSKTVSSS
jgi:hypothetical protein